MGSKQLSAEITVLLKRASAGDGAANERLAEAVYAELRRIARRMMAHERTDHTLQPTAVADEAFLNLIDRSEHSWENRTHFFAAATHAMRRILVDYARRRHAEKRGGEWHRVDAPEQLSAPGVHDEVLAVHEALGRLSEIDGRQGRIVELRYFGGLTEDEIAEVLGLSARTIKREWSVARAWLYAELTKPVVHTDSNRFGETV